MFLVEEGVIGQREETLFFFLFFFFRRRRRFLLLNFRVVRERVRSSFFSFPRRRFRRLRRRRVLLLFLLLVSIRSLCAVHLTTSKVEEHTDERKKDSESKHATEKKATKRERETYVLLFTSFSLSDSLSLAPRSRSLSLLLCGENFDAGEHYLGFQSCRDLGDLFLLVSRVTTIYIHIHRYIREREK